MPKFKNNFGENSWKLNFWTKNWALSQCVNGGSDTEIGYVCRFIIFYWFCHPKMAKINSNQLQRCRKKNLEAHCSGFCYFFLHKTSPWSFHSVTIDEEQKIFYNYISRFKNISDNVMTHKAKVVAFLRRISAKKHLTDFPHMTSIFRTFYQSERSELQIQADLLTRGPANLRFIFI